MIRAVEAPHSLGARGLNEPCPRSQGKANDAWLFSSIRIHAFIALLLGSLALGLATMAADPAIESLRIAQQKQLDALSSQYGDMVRENPKLIKPDETIDTSHPDYKKILDQYAVAKAKIQKKFSEQDTRITELKGLQQTFGTKLDPSGSPPKDVRADLDITAKTEEVVKAVVSKWKAQSGDPNDPKYNPDLGIWTSKKNDATLWVPPSKEQLAARSSYADAFSTPGGKRATGVTGEEAISDKEGFVLDNEKKFIHAAGDLKNPQALPGGSDDDPDAAEMATAGASLQYAITLKTAGKSISKAAESVGQTSGVAQQADDLRNYKDKFEAGITALGATPEQQQKDIQTFIKKADQQLQNSKAAAVEQSKTTRQIREDLAKQTEDKDKGVAIAIDNEPPPLPPTSGAIRDRNTRLVQENTQAQAANDKEREKLELAPSPMPNYEIVGTVAKPPTPASKTKDVREGTAKNAWWNITTTKDGDTTNRTTTIVTDTREGGHQVTVKDTKTTELPDGGKTTAQTKTFTTLGKGGDVIDKTITQSTVDDLGGKGKDDHGYITPTTKTQAQTTSTQVDGTVKQISKTGETRKTKGGGTVGGETSTTTQTSSDGTTFNARQKMSSYTGPANAVGKQTGVTTTQTSTNQTGTDGTTQTTTSKAVTQISQDHKDRSSSRTTTQTQIQSSDATGKTSGTKSITLTTQIIGSDGATQDHIFTGIKTTTTDAKGRTTTTDGESIVDSDGKGGKATKTHTTTEAPHAISKQSTVEWEQTHSGQAEDKRENKPTEGPKPVEKRVKWAGADLFEQTDKDNGRVIGGKNTERDIEGKLQWGQTGSKGQWELSTDNKDGTKIKVELSGELNLIKATGTASRRIDFSDNVTGQAKVAGTATVGTEGKVTGDYVVSREKVATNLAAQAFIGGKAQIEAKAAMSFWGVELGATGQVQASVGAGVEANIGAELSWTKIKVGGKLAGTLGLGMGGSTAVEVDATVAITGVDLGKVAKQRQAADAQIAVVRGLKDGSLQLPRGQKFKDISNQLLIDPNGILASLQKNSKKPVIEKSSGQGQTNGKYDAVTVSKTPYQHSDRKCVLPGDADPDDYDVSKCERISGRSIEVLTPQKNSNADQQSNKYTQQPKKSSLTGDKKPNPANKANDNTDSPRADKRHTDNSDHKNGQVAEKNALDKDVLENNTPAAAVESQLPLDQRETVAGWGQNKAGASKLTYIEDAAGNRTGGYWTHYDPQGNEIGKENIPMTSLPASPAPEPSSKSPPAHVSMPVDQEKPDLSFDNLFEGLAITQPLYTPLPPRGTNPMAELAPSDQQFPTSWNKSDGDTSHGQGYAPCASCDPDLEQTPGSSSSPPPARTSIQTPSQPTDQQAGVSTSVSDKTPPILATPEQKSTDTSDHSAQADNKDDNQTTDTMVNTVNNDAGKPDDLALGQHAVPAGWAKDNNGSNELTYITNDKGERVGGIVKHYDNDGQYIGSEKWTEGNDGVVTHYDANGKEMGNEKNIEGDEHALDNEEQAAERADITEKKEGNPLADEALERLKENAVSERLAAEKEAIGKTYQNKEAEGKEPPSRARSVSKKNEQPTVAAKQRKITQQARRPEGKRPEEDTSLKRPAAKGGSWLSADDKKELMASEIRIKRRLELDNQQRQAAAAERQRKKEIEKINEMRLYEEIRRNSEQMQRDSMMFEQLMGRGSGGHHGHSHGHNN